MAIAEQYDLLVIEDNPYGLLGFDHEPMRALRARNEERVIYLGSFSKTFSPGLRVGWVLAPLAVREKLVLATEAQVLCPPSLTQYAVARYLDTQPWREQIKIFTELYRERRDATLESLTALMPAGHHLDPARRRLLRVAEAAARAGRQAHAAPRGGPRTSPTCPASASTPTGRAGSTCGCPTATPSRTGSGRACAGWPGSSRPSWTCTPPSTRSTPAPSARWPSPTRRGPSSDRPTPTARGRPP